MWILSERFDFHDKLPLKSQVGGGEQTVDGGSFIKFSKLLSHRR